MKIKLVKYWNNPNVSAAMTAYNLGMLRVAAETENVMYILSKINELYIQAKSDGKAGVTHVTESKRLIDDVIYKLIRLGSHKSDFQEYPTIYGPRTDGSLPDIRNIEIARAHLIQALTPVRYL